MSKNYNDNNVFFRGNNVRRGGVIVRTLPLVVLTGIALIVFSVMVGCSNDTSGDNTYSCTNGTAINGSPATNNAVGCDSCDTNFSLGGDAGAGTSCNSNSYSCENGTPISEVPATNNAVGCASCDTNFLLRWNRRCRHQL